MSEQLTKFQKFKKHLGTIRKHRRVVRKWCFKMGIPIRGLLHDLSKYTISELSICKYYTGIMSPHDTARQKLGYSPSWFNHRNRNKHHWEYWVDSLERRNAVQMPYKYVIEMFCDFVGAGKVYTGDNWTPASPLKYHLRHKSKRIYHPETLYLFELLLCKLRDLGEDNFIRWYKDDKDALEGIYSLCLTKERFSYEI